MNCPRQEATGVTGIVNARQDRPRPWLIRCRGTSPSPALDVAPVLYRETHRGAEPKRSGKYHYIAQNIYFSLKTFDEAPKLFNFVHFLPTDLLMAAR